MAWKQVQRNKAAPGVKGSPLTIILNGPNNTGLRRVKPSNVAIIFRNRYDAWRFPNRRAVSVFWAYPPLKTRLSQRPATASDQGAMPTEPSGKSKALLKKVTGLRWRRGGHWDQKPRRHPQSHLHHQRQRHRSDASSVSQANQNQECLPQ